jgi:hypothetical protein
MYYTGFPLSYQASSEELLSKVITELDNFVVHRRVGSQTFFSSIVLIVFALSSLFYGERREKLITPLLFPKSNRNTIIPYNRYKMIPYSVQYRFKICLPLILIYELYKMIKVIKDIRRNFTQQIITKAGSA